MDLEFFRRAHPLPRSIALSPPLPLAACRWFSDHRWQPASVKTIERRPNSKLIFFWMLPLLCQRAALQRLFAQSRYGLAKIEYLNEESLNFDIFSGDGIQRPQVCQLFHQVRGARA